MSKYVSRIQSHVWLLGLSIVTSIPAYGMEDFGYLLDALDAATEVAEVKNSIGVGDGASVEYVYAEEMPVEAPYLSGEGEEGNVEEIMSNDEKPNSIDTCEEEQAGVSQEQALVMVDDSEDITVLGELSELTDGQSIADSGQWLTARGIAGVGVIAFLSIFFYLK